MCSATYSYTIESFDLYMGNIYEKHPEAIEFLRTNHSRLWTRSKFNEHSKVDYVNNNLSEYFNKCIMEVKGLQIVDLLDSIRQFIMKKFDRRRRIASKLDGVILPSIIKDLNKRSRGLRNYRVNRSGNYCAEVSGRDEDGARWRCAVHLDRHECTCRQWQLTGKSCSHALAFICSLRGANMHEYVDEYFTVERFRMAYDGEIKPMPDKMHWPVVNPGFKLHPPVLRRFAGRPRKQRIKASDEISVKRQHRCKRCGGLGYHARKCNQHVNGNHASSSHTKRKTSSTSRPSRSVKEPTV